MLVLLSSAAHHEPGEARARRKRRERARMPPFLILRWTANQKQLNSDVESLWSQLLYVQQESVLR